MDFKTYTDAVMQQKDVLSAYVSDNVAAIALPTTKQEMKVGKKNFNTISGWVFNIIGILAFIIGLIVGVGGIWIAGCASLTAGCYLVIKGKQQLEEEAYDNVGSALVAGVEDVVAHVSLTWTNFVNRQYKELRQQIVNSDMSVDDKVTSLGRITNAAYVHVDIDKMVEQLNGIDAREKLKLYQEYKPVAASQVKEALSLAATAQNDVYMEIIGPMPQPRKAAKPAPSPAAQGTKPSAQTTDAQPSKPDAQGAKPGAPAK